MQVGILERGLAVGRINGAAASMDFFLGNVLTFRRDNKSGRNKDVNVLTR